MFWMYEKKPEKQKKKDVQMQENEKQKRCLRSFKGEKEKKTSKITNKQQLREVGALKEKYFAKSVKKLLTREK